MTLSDRHLQLLTAFVDGEMTNRQRKAVVRLLHRSSEARSILRDLQENAHRLKELPRHPLDPQFAAEVVKAIQQGSLKSALATRRRPLPRWLKFVAAAACILLLAGLIYVANRPEETGPDNRPLAAPGGALRLAFKDIMQDGKRQLLAKQLKGQQALYLDITVKSNSQAVGRLTGVLRQAGIHTMTDGRVRYQLEKEQGQAQYLVYAENLKPEDVQDILRRLAAEDSKRKSTFESLAVSAMSGEHRQNLSSLLGVDAAAFQQPSKAEEAKLFEDRFIEAPTGKGKRDEMPPSLYTPPERFAVVLTNTSGEGSLSQEIKSFLALRKAQRPGTVQIIMVISQVST
jgi:hypothetical protein